MRKLKVSDVAKKIGVTARTVERWEKLGLISSATRDVRGWRFFDEGIVCECEALLKKLHPRGGEIDE